MRGQCWERLPKLCSQMRYQDFGKEIKRGPDWNPPKTGYTNIPGNNLPMYMLLVKEHTRVWMIERKDLWCCEDSLDNEHWVDESLEIHVWGDWRGNPAMIKITPKSSNRVLINVLRSRASWKGTCGKRTILTRIVELSTIKVDSLVMYMLSHLQVE